MRRSGDSLGAGRVTALALETIVSEELARVGLMPDPAPRERARKTVFSTAIPGFGLRIYSQGRRIYIVQRRIGGRMRTVTIGNAAVIRHHVARDVACRILMRCHVGENPAETRARVRAAPIYTAFLDEYWRRVAPTWRPTTQATNGQYRRAYLQGAFAGKFIDEIETPDVAKWFARMTDNNGPGVANRALALAKALMNKAEAWGYRAEGMNPCYGIRMNRSRKCERFLSDGELARLGAALLRTQAEQPVHTAVVTLIALTGCRTSEIINLRWSEVRGGRLLLPDSKTGPKTVWLGTAARAVINRFPRGKPIDRVFVFSAPRPGVLQGFWSKMRADAALPGVRLHDLRHSFASFAARQSETLPMIGKLLGHARIDSTARYTHLDDNSVLQNADRIGAKIARSCGMIEGGCG